MRLVSAYHRRCMVRSYQDDQQLVQPHSFQWANGQVDKWGEVTGMWRQVCLGRARKQTEPPQREVLFFGIRENQSGQWVFPLAVNRSILALLNCVQTSSTTIRATSTGSVDVFNTSPELTGSQQASIVCPACWCTPSQCGCWFYEHLPTPYQRAICWKTRITSLRRLMCHAFDGDHIPLIPILSHLHRMQVQQP